MFQFLTSLGQKSTKTAFLWSLAVGVFLTFYAPADAAIRYVDSSVASSGNGQSWATAWKSVANITGLAAGDTVYFSGGTGGKTYTVSNWTPAGGTLSNPITYAVGQDPGHTGMVTFNGSGRWLQGRLTGVTFNGEVAGQQRMTVGTGYTGDYIVYTDGNGTDGFKLLYVQWASGQLWLRGDHIEIGYCVGSPPVNAGGEDSMFNHIGDTGSSAGWGVNKFHHNVITLHRRKTAGEGWDCLKWCANIDVYNNSLIAAYNAGYDGHQHGDGWQGNGNYVRIYNNYFENWISYPILLEAYGSAAHWRIYNNIFYSGNESGIDWGAHQAIAIGFNPSYPGTFSDFIIANNTIIGNGSSRGIHFNYPSSGGSIGSGCYIVNNLIYNSASTVLYAGGTPTLANNVSGTAGISFVNNTLYPNGDFHLTSGASAAIDRGINPSYLTGEYTTDKDGATRTGTWDVGAYEYGGVSTPADTTAPSGSVTNPVAGSIVSNTITLSAAASDNLGGSGMASVTFLVDNVVVGTDTSSPYTTSWDSKGVTNGLHTVKVEATDAAGNKATSSTVSFTVYNPPLGTSFEAESGTVTAPFTVSGGAISQSSQTTLATGGRATYVFAVPSNDDYRVVATVNAPSESENSLFIDIDRNPTDPEAIWDIPVTVGFQAGLVASWRGSSSAESTSSILNRKTFTLSAGEHTLIIVGREANVKIDKIEIQRMPSPSGSLFSP